MTGSQNDVKRSLNFFSTLMIGNRSWNNDRMITDDGIVYINDTGS